MKREVSSPPSSEAPLGSAASLLQIIPVRHHSPAAAMAVEQRLAALRPKLVLVEGPCDATPMIPLLLQLDTRPPVAILAYRPAGDGEEPRTMVVPFCDYSPELVALRVAAQLGVPARFFDAPAGAFLDVERPEATAEASKDTLPDESPSELFDGLARRFGFSTHEEFWDARFEMAPVDAVLGLVEAYGQMVRSRLADSGLDRERDRAREAWMLAEVARAVEEGFRPEAIAVVCGAAHLEGIRAGVAAPELLEPLRRAEPARLVMIPYSYPRLSEQSGYGAGNRAPAFYQEVWKRRGDWDGSVLEFLLRVMNRMRLRGYSLSLADAIEARRLASNLGGMRDKPAAGLEELRDAATTCYGRGSYEPSRFLNELLIGEEVGAVTVLAAKTALQQEFLDQVKRHGIPFSDRPQILRLNLTGPADRASSAFLHRLQVAGVPFARLAGTGTGGFRVRREEDEDAFQRLMALRERWELCWTPSTDVRLIELGVHGNSLVEVCVRLLRARLEAARSLEESARVLLEVVTSRLEPMYEEALAGCERSSSDDDDYSGLARACYLLDVLTGYDDDQERGPLLQELGERVFARTCLLLPDAGDVSEEEAPAVSEGMKLLHQVAARRGQRGRSTKLLVDRLRRTGAGGSQIHPLISGLACAILYLDGMLTDEELAGSLRLRLSRGEEPVRAAQFVEGLFGLNRSVLVRNRPIVASLTDFLSSLERESFLAVLPVLRRSLATLNRNEMGYLVSTIGSVLGVQAGRAQSSVIDQGGLDELAALDQELGDLFS